MTIREAISQCTKEIKEVSSDSRLSYKFVYSKLVSKSSFIIQRESDALRISGLQGMYQTIPCVMLQEVPAIDPICKISSDLSLYRTCHKLPDVYFDFNGPMINNPVTLDRNKKVTLVTLDYLINNKLDTNSKYDKSVYAFYEDGYIYSDKPLKIKVPGFFVSDITKYQSCGCGSEDSGCIRFLDTKWFIPRKLEDAIISLVRQDLNIDYKRIPDQQLIDKNPAT